MFARLVLERDVDTIVEMAAAATAESFPHLEFSEERCRGTIQSYFETSDPTMFAVEDNGELVGFSLACWGPHGFSTSILAEQRVIYVKPENRGTRAAAELVSIYSQWAEQVGAKEIRLDLANGRRTEQAARYMRRFGFHPNGVTLRRTA
jgi:GNAT superfamily N-acetyltransferase